MTTEGPPDGDWIDVKLTLSLQALRFLRHLSDLTSTSFDDLASRLVSQALEREVQLLMEISYTPEAADFAPGLPQGATDTHLSYPLGTAPLPDPKPSPPPSTADAAPLPTASRPNP